MRYRWLTDWGKVKYVRRDYNGLHSKVGRCIIFSKPGRIGNVLVRWDDGSATICPAGCLRMLKEPEPELMAHQKVEKEPGPERRVIE